MTDFEDRARAAGGSLRRWMPDDPTPSPTTAVRRAVHRTRVHRAAAGTLLVAVLGGVGLLWSPSDGGDGVVIDPAVPDATDDTDPTTTVPETTTSTPATATPGPEVGPGRAPDDPGTTTPTTEAPEPPPSTCSSQVAGTGITFTATVPSDWHANEAALGEPACHHFGPQPIELRPTETEADEGVASNAVVTLYVSMGPGPKPTSFDQAVADETAIAASARRTTVDGRPAARFERTTSPGDDVPVGGDRYVHWMIDLGDVWFDAVTRTGPDVPYDMAAEAADQVIGSLRFSA